ncbi:MAG: tyrosine-type recombinase/integrase [Dysgonomonas mossii]|uniref:tyrosine-type recombinase/integrase n=1 Tax=Dysgonomonas mossii TaxID=163665 RepID=UPI0026EE8611|nr:site-specific integrase [Dysgonomonas mossii]MBS5908710.1 tyrosine-type recombinase/integrase [Dysgonomonas mossii]
MNNISIRFRFDKRNEASKTKQGLLHIEVREIGTNDCVLIQTGIRLYKNQFSDKMGFTCKNHDLADAITKQAHDIFNEIHQFAISDRCKVLKDVKGWKSKENKQLLIPFIESEMKLRNMEYNTLKAHVTLVNKLNDFKNIKTFADLTYTNIVAFDKYMRDKKIGNISINKNHSLFNMYIKIAINKELIQKSPYDLFTPPKGKNNDPVFLTIEEVERIKNLSGLNEKLERTRDLFVFQCFTGMAYVDMQAFSKNDIQILNGQEIIRSSRTKTDESFILLFLPEARKIAEKYNYNLPKISNQKYNDYLKLLIAHPDININKKVTSHTARHTFATYLLNKGISLETVSKTLGHSSIKQTQLYARILSKKVIDDMKKLL